MTSAAERDSIWTVASRIAPSTVQRAAGGFLMVAAGSIADSLARARHFFAPLALVLFGAAGMMPSLSGAQTSPPDLQTHMTGQFVLAEPRPAVEARLAGVVEKAVAPMSFLIRPIARSRLGRAVVFCGAYQLSLDATQVSVTCDALAPIRRKLDNSEGKLAIPGGDPVDVEVTVGQDSVALRFIAEEGQRTTTYRFDGDGGMEVSVQVTASQMEKPLEWKIRYRRSDAARS
jgi:hypothetical protein